MTKTFGRLSVLTAVFLVGINVVTPAQTNKVDVSGVWIFTVESPADSVPFIESLVSTAPVYFNSIGMPCTVADTTNSIA